MQLDCPHCHRTLHFAADRPSFCAYCGERLQQQTAATQDYNPEAATIAPRPGPDGLRSAAPDTVGGYRLIRPIGSGGMGTVYEAEEAASGRRVALKLISPDFVTSQESVDRFRQEGRLASMIAHPRCVFVLAAEEEGGRPYIVMELMSGSTLYDLVKKKGPLPPEEAVAKILDVIEGLQEAHRLGVIHRDVKPSNCFLEGDGRVKIGDFGLSKSLARDLGLTRTGAFMGTPLYASPEQIRSDRVNEQTDIYSVAATLYFLLTGQAPFETGDAAATLARIVSDPAPSMRSLRPGIPAALDKIVLRGLEKDRKRRWNNLEQLREALVVFLPSASSFGNIGLRIAAFAVDSLLLFPFLFVSRWLDKSEMLGRLLTVATDAVPTVLYFSLLEGLLGYSLGKRLLRLRVSRLRTREAPGLPTATLRTVTFYALIGLPALILNLIHDPKAGEANPWVGVFALVFRCAGLAAMIATMRARNGYQGLHEVVSGTRVVRLPWQRKSRRLPVSYQRKTDRALDVPERLGTFEVEGVVCSNGAEHILWAQDAMLERDVWIWLRPVTAAPISSARREINRTTSLRWLLSGKLGDWQWDAFLAPSGCPLPDLIRSAGRLAWADGHIVLEQLTDELAARCRAGCLPAALDVKDVWVEASGNIKLVDVALSPPHAVPVGAGSDSKEEEALSLLRDVGSLMLEGQQRQKSNVGAIRAPLPRHAALILERLMGGKPERYRTVAQVEADLLAVRDNPPEVAPAQRGAHLALLTLVLAVPVLIMFLLPAATLVSLKSFLLYGLSIQVGESESLRNQLEDVSMQDCVPFLVAANPLTRFSGVALLAGDQARLNALIDRQEEFRGEEQRLQNSAGWAVTVASSLWHRIPEPWITRNGPRDVRRDVQSILEGGLEFNMPKLEEFRSGTEWIRTAAMAGLVPWLPLWLVWSFLWRGGISLRLAGITLLRPNGKKALRIQCAWRTFLLWAPVVGLLFAASWLDTLVSVRWAGGTLNEVWWAPVLSWLSWGTALALLPAYAVLALRYPTRSLHDWLSGTYLMPR